MSRLQFGGGRPSRLDGFVTEITHGSSTGRPSPRRPSVFFPHSQFSDFGNPIQKILWTTS
jgi:hypothetical protein